MHDYFEDTYDDNHYHPTTASAAAASATSKGIERLNCCFFVKSLSKQVS